MAPLQKQAPPITQKPDEHILVVKRAALFPNGQAWQGIKKVESESYLKIIRDNQEFLPRSQMENDPNYKQIIPYLIFEHKKHYFLMQRDAKTTEQRLQNKFTLGIGGHIRQQDVTSGDIITWAEREFHEEVNYKGSFTIESLGILNDDSNAVGEVHLGFVFILHGNSPEISIKSELKQGELLTIEQCVPFYENMESWSQLVFNFLNNK